MQIILFIDGMNLVGKLKQVFVEEGQPVPNWHEFDFAGLFESVLQGIRPDASRIYFSRLHEHSDSLEKSRALIEEQRFLKRHLEASDFTYIVAGHVRARLTKTVEGSETWVFKEKGVDTRIAVDMVVEACDGRLKTAILASSDSDLQPAVQELKRRSVKQIYLGFETQPNKGLSSATDRTILIRNAEVLRFKDISKLVV